MPWSTSVSEPNPIMAVKPLDAMLLPALLDRRFHRVLDLGAFGALLGVAGEHEDAVVGARPKHDDHHERHHQVVDVDLGADEAHEAHAGDDGHADDEQRHERRQYRAEVQAPV